MALNIEIAIQKYIVAFDILIQPWLIIKVLGSWGLNVSYLQKKTGTTLGARVKRSRKGKAD